VDVKYVMKAIVYACSSYPKPGAPHRFSPENDFELCMVTGLATHGIVEEFLESLEKLGRGAISIGDVGLGNAMARCVEEATRELGHRLVIEIALSIPVAAALAWAEQRGEGPSFVTKLFMLSPPSDAKKLVDALRALGGEYAYDLEKADLSSRRVLVESLSLDDVLNSLARTSKRYAYVRAIEVHGALQKVMEYIGKGRSVSEALAYPYIELLEEEGVRGVRDLFEKRSIVELLRIDAAMKKRGERYTHLLPPVLYVATLACLRGL